MTYDKSINYALITLTIIVLSISSYLAIEVGLFPSLAVPATIIFLIMLFLPEFSYYIFFFSIALFLPYKIGTVYIHPFDICLGILFLSFVMDYVLNNHYQIRPAYFDRYFGYLIIITFISALFAVDISYSLVPLVRIIIIYIAFRMTFKFVSELGLKKIITLYIYLVALLSFHNSLLYIISHGEDRVFGLPWLTYETFAMTALPMSMAFFLWAKNNKERLLHLLIIFVIGFGIIATQSRAPLLTIILSVPVLLFVSFRRIAVNISFGKNFRLKYVIGGFILLILLVIIFKDTFFAGVLERYESFIASLTDPEGSIALRLILWSVAWKAFLLDPITGIGIGNFKIITQIIPEIQMAKLWGRVANMSAHNVFLQYLAETGLLGGLAIVLLAWKGFKTASISLRQKMSRDEFKIALSIYIPMFIFLITIFYTRDWTWGQGGYLLAFFFGLVSVLKHSQENNIPLS